MCHKFQGNQDYCLEQITILSCKNASFEIVVLGVVQLMDEHKIFIRNYHGICFWILTLQGVPLSALSMGCGLTWSIFGQTLGREGLAFVFHCSSSVSRAWLAPGSLQVRAALLVPCRNVTVLARNHHSVIWCGPCTSRMSLVFSLPSFPSSSPLLRDYTTIAIVQSVPRFLLYWDRTRFEM